ncbi:MAG: triose-phosphate isomerase [Chloroflexota bacterium]
MRPVIIAGNWKMNTTPADAGELAATIASRTAERSVERVICPPFVCLATVNAALEGSGVAVGAQDVHHEPAGAYTGDVSAAMLDGLATWVIVGHSERRRDHAETDERIAAKIGRAVERRLRPILCIGEPLEVRELGAGAAEALVVDQLRGALRPHEPALLVEAGLVVAYEPVWAIGTGRNARGADAAAMADAIRRALGTLGWGDGAGDLPILYGGSVTAANIGEFLAEPAIDGALVGGASLKPDEMAGIVARAALTANARLAETPVG